ncbi:MAG TPA: phage antirepressor N-terminal domain-containing protein [Bacteroidales bacterium]|nr:phage antirepressor N-terminal domain-containing protein [Bacteroidales bacterium]
METTKTIARVNDVQIQMIDNGQKLIPIKPICEALGISHQKQYEKLKSDEILSSTVTLRVTVGADEKEREMLCIPFMYVFGWLFTINPKNVKPEASEAVAKYRMECYQALFKHFTDQSDFLQQKQNALEKQIEEVERIRFDFKNTKMKLDEARQILNQIKETTFEQWQLNNSQLKLDFPSYHENDNE